jgi:hypothetical protein
MGSFPWGPDKPRTCPQNRSLGCLLERSARPVPGKWLCCNGDTCSVGRANDERAQLRQATQNPPLDRNVERLEQELILPVELLGEEAHQHLVENIGDPTVTESEAVGARV